MTNHVVRLYAFAGALLLLFLTWAVIAAAPWAPHAAAKADPRWAALVALSLLVFLALNPVALAPSTWRYLVVARRWRVYRVRLASRRRAISAAVSRHQRQLAAARASASLASSYSAPASGNSAAPSVRVVTLPPVTITRTS